MPWGWVGALLLYYYNIGSVPWGWGGGVHIIYRQCALELGGGILYIGSVPWRWRWVGAYRQCVKIQLLIPLIIIIIGHITCIKNGLHL